jgi:hypothetical protein
LRLVLGKTYRATDDDNRRCFFVKVVDELSNWEYDYNTYKCLVISPGEYFGQHLIIVTELWTIVELTKLEEELL